ncbi:hypothetical protein HDV05_003953 [Chytridiales sp. JEL 0842]|nr:hypothetical protein HDV05_003953 [Chytridiales sp. JEL 0842]
MPSYKAPSPRAASPSIRRRPTFAKHPKRTDASVLSEVVQDVHPIDTLPGSTSCKPPSPRAARPFTRQTKLAKPSDAILETERVWESRYNNVKEELKVVKEICGVLMKKQEVLLGCWNAMKEELRELREWKEQMGKKAGAEKGKRVSKDDDSLLPPLPVAALSTTKRNRRQILKQSKNSWTRDPLPKNPNDRLRATEPSNRLVGRHEIESRLQTATVASNSNLTPAAETRIPASVPASADTTSATVVPADVTSVKTTQLREHTLDTTNNDSSKNTASSTGASWAAGGTHVPPVSNVMEPVLSTIAPEDKPPLGSIEKKQGFVGTTPSKCSVDAAASDDTPFSTSDMILKEEVRKEKQAFVVEERQVQPAETPSKESSTIGYDGSSPASTLRTSTVTNPQTTLSVASAQVRLSSNVARVTQKLPPTSETVPVYTSHVSESKGKHLPEHLLRRIRNQLQMTKIEEPPIIDASCALLASESAGDIYVSETVILLQPSPQPSKSNDKSTSILQCVGSTSVSKLTTIDFCCQPLDWMFGSNIIPFTFSLLVNGHRKVGAIWVPLAAKAGEGEVLTAEVDVSSREDGSEMVMVSYRVSGTLMEQMEFNDEFEEESRKTGGVVGGLFGLAMKVLGLKEEVDELERFRKWMSKRQVGRFRMGVEILEVRVPAVGHF